MIARSWYKARIALQLIGEEHVGAHMRQAAEIVKADEDAAADALRGLGAS